MGKVRLEISPSLADVLNAEGSDWVIAEGSDWVILEKETGEWATIGDLLADLAFRHIDFRRTVFNPDTGEVSSQIMVALNGSLLQLSDVTTVKLKDGDTVVLVPVLYGG